MPQDEVSCLSTNNRVAAMDGMVENNMAKSAMMAMKDYFDPCMLVNWSGDPPALHMTTVLWTSHGRACCSTKGILRPHSLAEAEHSSITTTLTISNWLIWGS